MYFANAAGGSKAGLLHITGISWVSDDGTGRNIADTDQFQLRDYNANNVISKLAHSAGDGFVAEFNPPLIMDGMHIANMEGGVCYIYRR